MDNIKNNAKVIFLETSGRLFVFSHKKKIQIPFDPSYINNEEGTLDSRYFANLFQDALKLISPKVKTWNLVFALPITQIIPYSFNQSCLPQHQLEREVIYYFQHHCHINICDYEFILNFKTQKSAAIKKTYLQNMKKIFELVALPICVQFALPSEFEGDSYE
ncbi:MAG: hypothetical protein V4591_08815 [Bdellovibrionota bacterium]